MPLTGWQTYQTFIFSTFFKALLSFARRAFSRVIDEQKQNATATETELMLGNFFCSYRWNTIERHWWFSGRILACHAGCHGSIPGQCKESKICVQNSFSLSVFVVVFVFVVFFSNLPSHSSFTCLFIFNELQTKLVCFKPCFKRSCLYFCKLVILSRSVRFFLSNVLCCVTD